MHGQKEHGSQIMIKSVYIIAQLTRLSESESPSTSCVLMHGQKEHWSQIMIVSVYIIAQLTR